MYSLALSSVAQWTSIANKWCPKCIDTLCPHCNRTVTLTLDALQYDQHRDTIAANAKCPACQEISHFWIVGPGNSRDTSQRGCEFIGIYPKPRSEKKPIVEPDNLEPHALGRVYQSAFNAYNASLWDACATSCRKTLEGLVHTLLPEEERNGSLFEQLKKLPEKVDLSEPLVVLADTLRKGGNLGAHFNLEKAPDQHVAELMLDLLDYFMEYIFVLKEKAQNLETKIDSLKDH